jgi:hypothetical protein
MQNISRTNLPTDLALVVRVTPADTYEWSNVLLARARFTGTLELLTSAWERMLGYGRHEFDGKTLGALLRSDRPEAIVAAILDERGLEPVNVTLACRNGETKRFRLHRRFDDYRSEMFIVAEERHAAVTQEPRADEDLLLVRQRTDHPAAGR